MGWWKVLEQEEGGKSWSREKGKRFFVSYGRACALQKKLIKVYGSSDPVQDSKRRFWKVWSEDLKWLDTPLRAPLIPFSPGHPPGSMAAFLLLSFRISHHPTSQDTFVRRDRENYRRLSRLCQNTKGASGFQSSLSTCSLDRFSQVSKALLFFTRRKVRDDGGGHPHHPGFAGHRMVLIPLITTPPLLFAHTSINRPTTVEYWILTFFFCLFYFSQPPHPSQIPSNVASASDFKADLFAHCVLVCGPLYPLLTSLTKAMPPNDRSRRRLPARHASLSFGESELS